MLYIKFPTIKKFIFINPSAKKGILYGFSSILDKIGIENDVSVPNGSYVDVLSDPIEINCNKYGKLFVSKVKADVSIDYHTVIKEFWIPTEYLKGSK